MYLCLVTVHMYIVVSVINVFVPYVFVPASDSIDETSILFGCIVSVPSQGLLSSFAHGDGLVELCSMRGNSPNLYPYIGGESG